MNNQRVLNINATLKYHRFDRFSWMFWCFLCLLFRSLFLKTYGKNRLNTIQKEYWRRRLQIGKILTIILFWLNRQYNYRNFWNYENINQFANMWENIYVNFTTVIYQHTCVKVHTFSVFQKKGWFQEFEFLQSNYWEIHLAFYNISSIHKLFFW